MSRYTGPRVKVLRALGLDLPGLSRKSMQDRPQAPGQHGARKVGGVVRLQGLNVLAQQPRQRQHRNRSLRTLRHAVKRNQLPCRRKSGIA